MSEGMSFELDERLRALVDAGAALGKACKDLNPAQAAEDWRKAGGKELLRAAPLHGAALFLDAYAMARGSLRAARSHADDVIARAPEVFEAVLLAGAVEGLMREVIENVRLPAEVRPEGFPTDRDPDVRRSLAEGKAWSALARNMALRAAWVVQQGSPTAQVESAPPTALASACDAVLKVWPGLSRLVIGEEKYTRLEAEVFRPAAKARPGAMAAVARAALGDVPRQKNGDANGGRKAAS